MPLKTPQPYSPYCARLHPERPLLDEELEYLDHGRLAGVIGALSVRISGYAQALKQQGEPPGPQVIGLFGGYGHGKSSALNSGLLRSRSKDILRTVVLDVSLYRSEHLEDRLLRLLLWGPLIRGIAKRIGTVLLVLALPLLRFLSLLIGWEMVTHQVSRSFLEAGAWLVGIASFLLAVVIWACLDKLPSWLHDELAALGGWWDRQAYRLAYRLDLHPQLVVVDDLDRASLAQQRAMLRALYKHARVLRCLVIVAMDETPLLSQPGDPESPEELLRKTIQVQYRVPDRTVEDAALLAAGLCSLFARDNPKWPGKDWINSVAFVSDLASVLALTGAPAPRRAKRLLADVVARGEISPLAHPEDLHALLRQIGLETLCPGLRQPDRLATMLEENSHFDEGLKALGVNGDTLARTVRYLSATRHMLPADSRDVRRMAGGDTSNVSQPDTAQPTSLCRLLEVTAKEGRSGPRGYVLALGDALRHAVRGFGGQGDLGITEVRRAWSIPNLQAETPVWAVLAACEHSAENRLRLYEAWWTSSPSEAAGQVARLGCLRLWIADTAAWRGLARPQREALLESISESAIWPLLASLEPEEADLPFYLSHLPKAREVHRSYAHVFSHAWVRMTPGAEPFREMKTSLATPLAEVLRECWPPLQRAIASGGYPRATIFHAFSALGAAMRFGLKEIPPGFTAYLRSRRADAVDTQTWLDALRVCLAAPDEWRLDLAARWSLDTLPLPVVVLLTSAKPFQLSRKAWLTALSLAHALKLDDAVGRLLNAPTHGHADSAWLLALVNDENHDAIWRNLMTEHLKSLGLIPALVAGWNDGTQAKLAEHLQKRGYDASALLTEIGFTFTKPIL